MRKPHLLRSFGTTPENAQDQHRECALRHRDSRHRISIYNFGTAVNAEFEVLGRSPTHFVKLETTGAFERCLGVAGQS